MSNKKLHSIVLPIYNEVQGIQFLYERMHAVSNEIEKKFNANVEVILVNDGSKDGSDLECDRIQKLDNRFKVIHLSRNFGHQIAITCGIDFAQGDTVTVLDADLQDPPEVILDFIQKWNDGYEVVYGVRRVREGETPFKLITAKVFYRILKKLTNFDIPVDTGDFRLMDRKAVEALKTLREQNRFIRGLVSWVGFKQIGVEYDRQPRRFGQTHYPFKKMFKFALDGVTAFSTFPLKLATYIGLLSVLISFCFIVWALYAHFIAKDTIQGWTSIIIIISFLGGIQLFTIGILGEYIGRIYDESRRRPLYFVSRKVGF
jgi:dolichol-phosphate mannosyltransferase